MVLESPQKHRSQGGHAAVEREDVVANAQAETVISLSQATHQAQCLREIWFESSAMVEDIAPGNDTGSQARAELSVVHCRYSADLKPRYHTSFGGAMSCPSPLAKLLVAHFDSAPVDTGITLFGCQLSVPTGFGCYSSLSARSSAHGLLDRIGSRFFARLLLRRKLVLLACLVQLIIVGGVAKIPDGGKRLLHAKSLLCFLLPLPAFFHRYHVIGVIEFVAVVPEEVEEQLRKGLLVRITISLQRVNVEVDDHAYPGI
ncbi:hypothetical protein KC316_g90 [Hortaea werneckii]|nr:hypothetical protein KC316_g90 [Hortaea werneckii]